MRYHLGKDTLISACVLVLVLGFIPLAAQTTPADSLPSADQIIEKYVQAVGGKAALEKLTSRVSTGTIEFDVMPGAFNQEIYEKAPNKQCWIMDAAQFGVIRLGYNGTVGWEDNPQTGLRELDGMRLAVMKRTTDFYRPIKLKEIYPKMAVTGKEAINGHDAYVLEATPPDGPAEWMYFDTDSGLLVRHKGQNESPTGPVMVETTTSDYHEVDGIKLPFTTYISRPDISFTIRLSEVKHNVPIEDSKFDKPAGE